jgi:pimeloyl-ACP methyl ester carboxylesterase
MMESLAGFELWSHYASRGLMALLPKGDGHTVVVLPGFLASDVSTRPLRRVLGNLGYDALGWELGRNLKFDEEREEDLTNLVLDAYERQGKPVSLVGWSLGGVFSRELAKQHPDKVRMVITLGTPFNGDTHGSRARPIFTMINGEPEVNNAEMLNQLHVAPPVPTTSIFTKSDGIVPWPMSIQGGDTGDFENVQVPASHLGIGVNPIAISVVADRLAQDHGDWAPYEPSGLLGGLVSHAQPEDRVN